MKNERFRAALSFAAHLVILASTVFCVLGLLLFVERPDERVHTEIFRYYTTLSNILGVLIAVPVMVGAVLRLAGKETSLPAWLQVLRFVSVSALTVTMMTVVLFLGPRFGWSGMFEGANYWFHLVNPLLSIFSYLFLEPENRIPRKYPFAGTAQTVLYGAVYIPMVLSGTWPDFYGFNIGGRWYLSLLAMLAANLLLAWLLLLGRNVIGYALFEEETDSSGKSSEKRR